jgi:hypothetical protein
VPLGLAARRQSTFVVQHPKSPNREVVAG